LKGPLEEEENKLKGPLWDRNNLQEGFLGVLSFEEE